MKRVWLYSTVSGLGLLLLFMVPELARGGSMRSGSSRSMRSTSAPIVVATPTAASATTATAEEDYAYGALDDTASKTAVIRLRVPVEARVSFNGAATSQSGSLRTYVTGALEPGKDYSYQIQARWTEGGRALDATRTVTFRSGDRLTLNLTPSR
jgi:uncharacterized protein (TIGR03000 family)